MNTPNYFAVIPATVRYDNTLPPAARLLYGEIAALANKEGYCWASNKYFSELYEVEERSIRRWVELLQEKKYIGEYREGGRRRLTISTPLVDNIVQEPLKPDKNVQDSGQKCPFYNKNNIKEYIGVWNAYSKKRGEIPYPEDFEAWYKAYPNAQDKKDTLRMWCLTLQAGATPEELFTAGANYASTVEGKEKQYTKHSKTFLGPREPWRDFLRSNGHKPVKQVKRCSECGAEFTGTTASCLKCGGVLEEV